MLKIAKLEISNLGALDKVSVDLPSSGLVPVSGKNGSGKSTLLQAIRYLWNGVKKSEAEELIRNGEKKAEITVNIYEWEGNLIGDIDNEEYENGKLKYIMSRTITADGASPIVIKTPEGARFPSPGALADSFRKDLGLDPSEFARMNDLQQYDTIMKLASFEYSRDNLLKELGIEDPLETAAQKMFVRDYPDPLQDLDQIRKKIYEERKRIGAERDFLDTQVRMIVIPPDKESAREIDVIGLMKNELALREIEKGQVDLKRELAKVQEDISFKNIYHGQIEEEMKELDQKINDLVLQKAKKLELREKVFNEMIEIKKRELEIKEKVEALPDLIPQFEAITHQMQEAEENNRWAKKVKDRLTISDQAELKRGEYNLFTEKIEKLDSYKGKLLSSAVFPLPGLSVDDETQRVVYNGIPIKRLGECEQTIVGCAIAASLRPQLRLIVCPHDILVDNESRAKWQEWCKENNFQVLYCDLVKDSDDVAVFIEVKDGSATVVQREETGYVSVGGFVHNF